MESVSGIGSKTEIRHRGVRYTAQMIAVWVIFGEVGRMAAARTAAIQSSLTI